jgi:hypothetical protein
MRHAPWSLLLAPALLATAPAARADYFYTFTFSGTISNVDDQTVFNGNTIRLLPDVHVGDPYQGSGFFTVPFLDGSGPVPLSSAELMASGSGLLAFSAPNPAPTGSFVPSTNFLRFGVGAPFPSGPIPIHVAVPPTLTQFDFLQAGILTLSPSPGGSSLHLDILHNSLQVRNNLSVDVAVTTYSIVPEPGSLPLLAVGACGALAAGSVRRRRRRRAGSPGPAPDVP